MSTPQEQEEAIAESWRVIHSLVTAGEATLKLGKKLVPSPEVLVRLMENMARMKPPRQTKMALPEGFTAQQTSKGPHGAAP